MQIGHQKNEKKGGPIFTIQNIFGQSLALANIAILNEFNYSVLDSSGSKDYDLASELGGKHLLDELL